MNHCIIEPTLARREERGGKGGSRESRGNEEGRDREDARGKIMLKDVGMCVAVMIIH